MAIPSTVPLIRYDLALFGRVTRVIDANTFRAAGLVGQGDGTFQDYNIYVLRKADGTTDPPHREQEPCVAYNSAAGEFIHMAFTDSLAVGDSFLLLHPALAAAAAIDINHFPGATVHNWEAAEQTVTTIGGLGVINKVHSLLLDINALAGNITVRLLHEINGEQRRVYEQIFTVAVDGPGLWIVNGTLAIHGLLVVTLQSDDAGDNGESVGWQYILEST